MNPPAAPQSNHTGLIAWLEETRVALPLKGVEARFELYGDLLDVEIDQIYHQNQNQRLDVTYSFPLPVGAAVHRCEMRVNGRTIAAKVIPWEQALELVAQKKAEGRRTALVETVRANLFELGLGNLAPGDTVVIRLSYVQTVERDGCEGDATFRIPLTPGIRYIPGEALLRKNLGNGGCDDTDQVPDASKISPPRIDASHRDAAYLSLEGTMDPAGWDGESVTSPSHPLLVRREDDRLRISLVGQAEVPDRDVVVRLRSAAAGLVQAGWSCVEDGQTYALLRLVAPPVVVRGPAVPRDYYFLVDQSGSMAGAKWSACIRAFREFLLRMESLDRACVTFFSTDFTDLAEKPMPSAAILAEAAMDRLDDLSVGGGTELLPALHHVLQMLERHRSPERQSTLVLITDGQVGNEQAIHEELKPWCGKLRVHTFGIDTAVNDSFLRQLAEEHGGSSTLATPEDNIPNLVAGIARRFGTEVVRELQIGSPWEGSGAPVGALWEGDALTLCMRTAEEIAEVVIAGKSGADGAEVSFRIPVAPISGAGPRLRWQRQRLHALERECRDDEAAALACAANLLSSGTAFVAWDEEERIALTSPRYSVYQPSLTDRTHLAGFAPLAACSPMVLYGSGGRSLPRSSMCLQAPALPLGSASRLEEPPPEAHRPSEMDRLPKLLGIEDGAAVRLVDWLEQWIWLSPSQSKERKKSLRKLIGKLAWISNTEKRIDQFSAWLIASVEEPVLTAIQRVLKEVNLVP